MGKILVIGGAGFIGCNLAKRFLDKGREVVVFDNFSRKGSEKNLEWLKESKGKLEVVRADIRTDQKELERCAQDAEAIYHLAAQVAVTTSVTDPREDFEINALGTFNVLEAARKAKNDAVLIFASTNKVYGKMENVKVGERNGRYEYSDLKNGIAENFPLDFHSPYGCSKGAGDQYVRDYARIYGMKNVVLRQSCIYGPRQFGIEDQGWVAWFCIASALGKPITIYGDGKQIRDVLHVADLTDAFELATEKINKTNGRIYNIGGGPKNTMSLLELVSYIEDSLGIKIDASYDDWRPGDQKVFVSNINKAKEEFGWEPKIEVKQGVQKLIQWVSENKNLFE